VDSAWEHAERKPEATLCEMIENAARSPSGSIPTRQVYIIPMILQDALLGTLNHLAFSHFPLSYPESFQLLIQDMSFQQTVVPCL
jgi:hypothetical protein